MIRPAQIVDLPQLVCLEKLCFQSNIFSGRQFRYLLTKAHSQVFVIEEQGRVYGYIIVLFSRVTSIARIYSLAVDPGQRGRGFAKNLVACAEAAAMEQEKTSVRLEIREDNQISLRLLTALGYKTFDRVPDYYADHQTALRLEKNLSPRPGEIGVDVPYYEQSLEFTCGPAALMMAMKALNPDQELSRREELRLWREATTIFMTSGLGGCGPQGLALAAARRGFGAEIYLNSPETFLIDSVRSPLKKQVMALVEEDMSEQCMQQGLAIHHQALSLDDLQQYLVRGAIPLVLISSWAIYGEKSPHWLVVIGMDEHYVYVHDPLIDHEKGETLTDSVSMPIGRFDFQRMARYGKKGQRAVVLIWPSPQEVRHD
jgi:ribosomal protein S18 acetylase RimI-like enzyme/predicted double-glycine peptidase